MIADFEAQRRERRKKRQEYADELHNTKMELNRLHAERDSLKGEEARITKEMAAEEIPGKDAEFTQGRQQRERALVDAIEKQRTMEQEQEQKIGIKEEEVERLLRLLDVFDWMISNEDMELEMIDDIIS